LHRSIQSDSTVSPQTYDTTAVISLQFCQFGSHSAGNSIGCKSHSDTWADPSKIAQGLEPAAHNSLFAGSVLFKSDPNGACADYARTTRLSFKNDSILSSHCNYEIITQDFRFRRMVWLENSSRFFCQSPAGNSVTDLFSIGSKPLKVTGNRQCQFSKSR
jgi:hypothetical protein